MSLLLLLSRSSASTVSHVGVTHADYTQTTVNTPQSIVLPTGTVQGDLIVIFVSFGTTGTVITGPGAANGWTEVGNPMGGSDEYTSMWWKYAGASEPQPTIASSDLKAVITCASYRNVNPTTPLDITPVFTDDPAGATHPVQSMTVSDGALLVSYVSADGTTGAVIPQYTAPSGWTKRLDALNNTADNYVQGLADFGPVTAGTYSGYSWGSVYTDRAVNVLSFALRAIGSSGPAPSTPTLVRRIVGVGRVRSWTTNATSVRLKVGTDSAVTTGVSYTSAITPDASGMALHDTSAFSGGKKYYRVSMTVGGVETDSSEVGAFKTPPTGAFNFCGASCCNAADSTAMSAIAARDDDLFIHLGDQYYDDAASNAIVNFRSNFAAKADATNHKAVYTTTPVIAVSSDHDLMGNNVNGASDPTAATNYNTVHREFFATPLVPATTGFYTSIPWGPYARFIALDLRTFASLFTATDDASKTLLGATQKQWLKDEITAATERWIILVGDVPWTGAAVAGDDAWDGFTTERAELGAFFAATGKNIVYLGGDMHALAADNGSNSVGGIPVFQCSPLNNTSSHKGTPYSTGTPYPAAGIAGVEQYGRFNVNANTIDYVGYSADNIARVTLSVAAKVTVNPTAIGSGESFGSTSVSSTFAPQTLSPTAIGSSEALGSPTVTPVITMGPSAIASAEALGSSSVTTSVTSSPTGIASAQALGTASVTTPITSTPVGIGTAESLGTATASFVLTSSPSAIASGEGVGTQSITSVLTSSPSGVASVQAFGTTSISTVITTSPSAIGSSEAFGTTSLTAIPPATSLSPSAITSSETFGTTAVTSVISLAPTGVATGQVLGTPTVSTQATMSASAVGSSEAFGTSSVNTALTLVPSAIASAEAFGTITISTAVTAINTAIASTEVFGTTSISSIIALATLSVASAQAFGTPSVTSVVTSTPTAIAGVETFGSPTISSSVLLSPSAITSAEALGTPSSLTGLTLAPAAIASGQTFGSTSISTSVLLSPVAISSAEASGSPVINVGITLSPPGIASATSVSSVILSTLVTLTASGIASGELVSASVIVSGTIGLIAQAITSLEGLGAPTATVLPPAAQTLSPGGIASAQAFGASVVSPKILLSPSAIASSQALGNPVLNPLQLVSPTGIVSLAAIGVARLETITTVSPASVASTEVFGVTSVAVEIIFPPDIVMTASLLARQTYAKLALRDVKVTIQPY